MRDALARLQLVEKEIGDALKLADNLVAFVDGARAPADLRVLVCNNMVVSLASIVEEGIRALATEYLAIVQEYADGYSKLRPALAEANLTGAIELLRKSQKDTKLDTTAIVAQLSKCLSNGAGFELFSDEITYNRANMRSKQVSEITEKLGMREFWKAVQAQPSATALYPDLEPEQRVQGIVAKWNGLFDERDLVVHRFSQASGWGPSLISDYVSFLTTIISCMTRCLHGDALLATDYRLGGRPELMAIAENLQGPMRDVVGAMRRAPNAIIATLRDRSGQ
ncbi:MAG: hypothetical protein E5V21_00730 [Mesorhizobium sp.]|nr:MAG: hypothetical protein E5V21_00730 [Mesorhizobium sp.]